MKNFLAVLREVGNFLAPGVTLHVVANTKTKARHRRTTQRKVVPMPLKCTHSSRER